MPRQVSNAIRALLDSHVAESHDTVDIILPLKVGQTEADRIRYFIASVDGISYNGNAYLPMLRSIGALKFSLGRSPDNAEITVENVSRTFGSMVTDSSRKLDGSRVIIRRAFKTAPSTYEPVDLLHGIIKDVKANQETVSLSIVSDMSRRTSQVASRAVTQRCIWTFRGAECGWTPDQGGNDTFCSKVYVDANGCSGHNNQPRFGGVPTLSPTVREIVNPGPIGGWNGWDEVAPIQLRRPWAIDPDYPINSFDRGFMPAERIWERGIDRIYDL